MDDFLQAVLSGMQMGQARKGRLQEIEQRALDRVLQERQLQAQIDHQRFLEKLQQDQFAESRRARQFEQEQARQNRDLQLMQAEANGLILGAAPVDVTPKPFTLPGTDITLPSAPISITPPGTQFEINGKKFVPADPTIRAQRAARVAGEEAEARATGELAAQEAARKKSLLDRQSALQGLYAVKPDIFGDRKDLQTRMDVWANLGVDLGQEGQSEAMGRILSTLMDGTNEQKAAAMNALRALGSSRPSSFGSPAFARDTEAAELTSRAIASARQQLQASGNVAPTEDQVHQAAGTILTQMASNPEVQPYVPLALQRLATLRQFRQPPKSIAELIMERAFAPSPFPGMAPAPTSAPPRFYPKK
jgi:hypothetical protein